MKRTSYVVVALVAVFAMVLSACTAVAPATTAPAAGEQATAAAAGGEAKKLKVVFSVPGMEFPFFVFMETQVRDEADKLGIELITMDGQNKLEKQTADMEAAIAQKVDAVLISPITSDGMAPAIQQVIDAGIPVVTVDRSATGVTGLLAHVGADNVKGGEQQGEAIVKLFPDGASIFELLGTPGASPAIDRGKGLHNIIDPAGNIKVACQQTGEFNRDKGMSVTENCLGATPKPDAIVAANDDMALGAVEAAKAANVTAPIVGYDALPESLAAIQAGTMYATVEQFPGQQARTGLDTLIDFVTKGTKPTSDKYWITPKLISKDNIQEAERIGEVK